ncbi:13217_t:CDS:2 [Cetraspora pellucida]|uniref:13217_t:CDS:1 n=1 Tax=Cetraspora pellucida TaxID=1433469 RepID=A0A9N9B2K4_9GLOM|nr:13217_t:CDS:2 [Cetraspora pellucida]
MAIEQNKPSINTSNLNNLKKSNLINAIDNQNSTFKKNTTSILISKHDIMIELLNCNKENKTKKKEFILVIFKKNNQKRNKKKAFTTSNKINKSKTENA